MIGNLLTVLTTLTVLLIAALSLSHVRLARVRVPVRVANPRLRHDDECR